MAELVWQRAQKEAEKFLSLYQNENLSVLLKLISDYLLVDVYFADLGKRLHGVLSKNSGERACCVINSRQTQQMRQWTWAHQLGHVVERELVSCRGDEYSFNEFNHPQEEDLHDFFANEFAGALLVPQQHLTDEKGEWLSPREISNTFDVALTTAEWRLNMVKKRIHLSFEE